jgi:hypothetical protein
VQELKQQNIAWPPVCAGRVVLGSYFQRSGSAQRSVSVNLRATTTFSALTSAQRSNLLKIIDVVSII